jgi:hypothetical protein
MQGNQSKQPFQKRGQKCRSTSIENPALALNHSIVPKSTLCETGATFVHFNDPNLKTQKC